MVRAAWAVVKKRANRNPKSPKSPYEGAWTLRTNLGTRKLNELMNRYVALLLSGGNSKRLENNFKKNYRNIKRENAEAYLVYMMSKSPRSVKPPRPPIRSPRSPSVGSALRRRTGA